MHKVLNISFIYQKLQLFIDLSFGQAKRSDRTLTASTEANFTARDKGVFPHLSILFLLI